MIDSKTKVVLEEIGASEPGKILKEYLDEKIKTMKGDVDSVESWEDILAARKAKAIIKEVFYFLEPREQIKKEKNQYL